MLEGAQGIGKSTALRVLADGTGQPKGRRSWFSDSVQAFVGKDAQSVLRGSWIVELGELAAMRRAEIEHVKSYLSRQEGAIGWGMSAPRIADGTEVESKPAAGNGGGQQILHSRVNLAIHPSGFQWTENEVEDESPTIAELADPLNWARVVERKAVGLAFLRHRVAPV